MIGKRSTQIRYLCMISGFALFFSISGKINIGYAGAWVMPHHQTYLKFSYLSAFSDEKFDIDENLERSELNESSVYMYLEYGIFQQTSLILSTAIFKYLRLENADGEGSSRGFLTSDTELQAKYQLITEPLVISGLAGVKFPVGYKEEDTPSFGTGEVDYDLKVLLGKSFYPLPIYSSLDFGYRFKGGEHSDEVKANFELGIQFYKKYRAKAMADYRYDIDAEWRGDSNHLMDYSENQMRVGAGLAYAIIENIEVDLSYLFTVKGQNTQQSHEIYLGVATNI